MAESLLALMDGDRNEMGRNGAMLIAEALINLRDVSAFVRGYAKAGSRKRRR